MRIPFLKICYLFLVLATLFNFSVFGAELQQIKKGEYIFRASGGCGCHTNYEDNGAFLAGGRPIKTPFGIFYGTNITPDKETGIGKWSDTDFIKAMTQGVSPDGKHYAPVFPYTSFTQMTEEDLLSLKAYLSSIPPIKQENKPHDLWIPFGERLGFFIWKKLHFTEKKLQPDPAKSEQWNRGAYLSQAIAHCEECHTPRDLRGVLKKSMRYAGSEDGPEGELAPNITPDKETGVGEWNLEEITEFLETGIKPDTDDVQGLMSEVIENGFAYLKQEDLKAMAFYLQSLPPIHNQISSDDEEEEESEFN